MDMMLKACGLTKRYGEKAALESADMALSRGRVTAMMGPNGSGKTTMIKLLLGIARPDEGHVELRGERCVCPMPVEARRRFLYVPDDPIVTEYLTGRENLEYMAEIYGVKLSREQITAILEEYGLLAAGDTLAKDYSRGMRQRLCLSYMEIYAPEILILDEPTNGLDILAIADIAHRLRKMAGRGKTVLIATHDMSFCRRAADDIAIFRQGHVVCVRQTEEMVQTYGSMEKAAEMLLSA